MHENNRINNSNISKVCTFAIYQFKGSKRKQSVFNVVFSCAATNSVYNSLKASQAGFKLFFVYVIIQNLINDNMCYYLSSVYLWFFNFF